MASQSRGLGVGLTQLVLALGLGVPLALGHNGVGLLLGIRQELLLLFFGLLFIGRAAGSCLRVHIAQLVLRGVQSCRSLFFGGLSGSQSVVYLLLALRNDVHDRLVQELAEQQKQHQNVDDCIQKVQIQCQHSSCLRDQPRNRMMIRATTKPKIAVPSARAAPSSRLV